MAFQSPCYSPCIEMTLPLPPIRQPGSRRKQWPNNAAHRPISWASEKIRSFNDLPAQRIAVPQVIVRKSSGSTVKVPIHRQAIARSAGRESFNFSPLPSRIPVFQRPGTDKSFHLSPEPLISPLIKPRSPLTKITKGNTTDEHLSSEKVAQFLRANPSFLEQYVAENVGADTIERWKRSKRRLSESKLHFETEKRTSSSKWKYSVHKDKKQMLLMLMNSLSTQPHTGRILWELACCIASAVSADGFVLHLVDRSGVLKAFRSGDTEHDKLDIGNSSRTAGESADFLSSAGTLAAFVAKHKRTVIVSNVQRFDARFPVGSSSIQEGGVYVLGAPVTQNDGTLTGVIEFYRRSVEDSDCSKGPFREEDDEIVSSYLVWGGVALHYADVNHALSNQRTLHQFLLNVVKSIFQDMVSMDTLIGKVMTFAQKLVDADRTSLFLIDHKAGELYARIFDMGDGEEAGPRTLAAQEIRFPIGTGIAGHVAVTGEVLNIPDAYSDPRFNRTVDQRTGYHTQSILCMPIFIQGQVIGVVQMVNKRNGAFTEKDEESFELFAVYCGLALHHAKLYDRIQLSEQRYRVALDVLSYHNCCTDEEVDALQSSVDALPPPGLDEYVFDVFGIDDLGKASCSVLMFVDLFGLARFDRDSLIRFVLTVKKNYRRVPYHNWTHGFSVANTMYVLLKRSPDVFETLEALSLFIGSLCHDLDHRGKNNKFMLDSASPLASLYTTSTMEHHHFNQTVTILQQEGHNIFSKLSSDEYKEVLQNIKHCILATDLALFMPNRAKLARIVEAKRFTWTSREHRLLVQAIAMTGADLSASSKPWDIQAETVNVIMEEFYQQGDDERRAGRTPLPSMDRTKPHLKPDIQVGFISNICIPCYGLLSELMPGARPLLDGCVTNVERWKLLVSPESEHRAGEARSSDSRGSLSRAASLPVRFDPDAAD